VRAAFLATMLAPAALASTVVACGACEPEKAPAPDASPSVTAAATPHLPPPQASTRHERVQPKVPCRAITVEGDVHVEQATPDAGLVPVLIQGLAPAEAWVDLGKGARLVTKDPRTTRETSFRGVTAPGRARACVGFTEESWVQTGFFESSVGAGEAPGAEEWVVTPFGVVRYAAAKVSVDVGGRDAQVKLETGTAFVWSPTLGGKSPGDGGGNGLEDGWLRLPAGTTRLATHEAPGGVDAARTALDRCVDLASTTRVLTVEVMSPDGGADGGTIAAQVAARRLARAACAVASLRVQALPEADAAPLRPRVSDANSMWSSLPTAH
jgi:hypothetical protein